MSDTRERVSVIDLAKGAIGMIPDLPGVVRHAPSIVLGNYNQATSIGLRLERLAARHPDAPFVKFEGQARSYREVNAQANRIAAVLAEQGVGSGDVVAVLAPNNPDTIAIVMGIVKLGAVAGMLNYNQTGSVLDHSLGVLRATAIVFDPEVRDVLATATADQLPAVQYDFGELAAAAADKSAHNPESTKQVLGRQPAFYIFTSGTTGLPKASVMSHARWLYNMAGLGGIGIRLRPGDTMYSALPLYHNNALSVALGSALANGAAVAIARKFSASKFWDDYERNNSTAFIYIGELCRYLLAQPPRPDDAKHHIKVITGNGLRPEIWDEFTTRFNIGRVLEFFAGSESNSAFLNIFNVSKTTGFNPLPYVVVEYNDDGTPRRDGKGRVRKVGAGGTGLMMSKISPRHPFEGYTDDSASEKKIVRNAFKDGDAYFNTGDLVRDQRWHHAAFVDRLGDTFRWKGENVATSEVERVLGEANCVSEAVVYGVEVPGADGRAGMAAVTVAEGHDFDCAGVGKLVATALPKYAVPLFVRIVPTLEVTSTFKNRKVELRDEAYGDVPDLYVYVGGDDGYVQFYDDYPSDVGASRYP